MLSGSIVALVTPFGSESIDEDIVRELVEFQIESGTSGIVVAGCTGESFTLNYRERNRLTVIANEQAKDRVPIIVGTGSPSLESALLMSKNAKDLNADYILVISPAGNKPSQEAMFSYFSNIARISPPVIVYNVPSRTGMGIEPATVVRLADLPNIVGIKEASGNLDNVSYILERRPNFAVFSGDDTLTLPMLALGASGVISTVANIKPREMSEMVEAFFAGNLDRARKLHYELFSLTKALFLEGNPVPLKEAMNLMGIIVGDCRPPLGRMTEKNRETLLNVLLEKGYLL